jgi:hypothetical protein
MIYAYITGGGSKWIYDSLKNGGASKWFLGARVPYSKKDFDEILNGSPNDGKYVSQATAIQLSTAALNHALKVSDNNEDCIGLGVTCKLKTKGQREGRENIIIVAGSVVNNGQPVSNVAEYSLPSWLPRFAQEYLCSRYIKDFLNGKGKYGYSCFDVMDDLNLKKSKDNNSIILYSGSFNPIHETHIDIANMSKSLFDGHEFCLEIPYKNFSKGYISANEIYSRKAKIKTHGDWQVLISDASNFTQKAKILKDNGYSEIIFPMGDDTYDRITDDELNELDSLGVKILLFRRNKDIVWYSHNVIHPMSYSLPKLKSISSTELRKNAIQ